jgi:hypothetical protein
LIFLNSLNFFAQKDAKEKTWKSEKDYLKYERKKDFKGPDEWYGGDPSSIKSENENYTTQSNQGTQGIQYSPQRISQERERKFGKNNKGGGTGTLDVDPEVKKPDPITLPEIDPPDIDAPDVDLPDIDVDVPSIPIDFWKIVLFIIIFVAVIVLVYLWLKNRAPSSGRGVLQDVENDWNPTVISKSDLELRLEEALARDDYREGIRIYFTFILKELIRKNWIHWKKDKTNHHYALEMAGRPKADLFRECIRIYDLVWYGEYEITKEVFLVLQPTLLNYYRSLEPSE